MDLIDHISKFWELIAVIATGIGGFFTWKLKFKTEKNETLDLLIAEMDRMRDTIVNEAVRKIKNASTIARQEAIIEELRTTCPECYQKVMDIVSREDA